jgi:hypothetical protein
VKTRCDQPPPAADYVVRLVSIYARPPREKRAVPGDFAAYSTSTVVYVPGEVAADEGLGDDQWACRLDNGNMYACGYFHSKRSCESWVEFVSRPGEEAREVLQSFRMPPEPEPKHLRAGLSGADWLRDGCPDTFADQCRRW